MRMGIKVTQKVTLLEDLYYWRFQKPTIRFHKRKTYTFPFSIAEALLNQQLGYTITKIK
jgi:hypothetical protein